MAQSPKPATGPGPTSDIQPEGLSPRSTVRGRPRTRDGRADLCARCGRNIPRIAATWPEGRLCNPCYYTAIHTHGLCPGCGQERLLPGPADANGRPTCTDCAGLGVDFHCARCGTEAGHHRGRVCVRCILREDLHDLLGGEPTDPALVGLVDALCAADRPESIITWKRSEKVQALLRGLGTGEIAATHAGLDATPGRATEHLRALLVYHQLLPARDPYLPKFEQWITTKLAPLPEHVRQPVEQFATWHHLRRIRTKAADGEPTQAPVHAAKQEITETIKFLTWLDTTHQRTSATATQQDVDEYLTSGPTTRHLIRTFFVLARKSGLNTAVVIGHRTPKTVRSLSQDQRIAWIHELLTGTSETLAYRVAGVLLLLYAQPLVRVVALPATAIADTAPLYADIDADTADEPNNEAGEMTIRLGSAPIDVPEPFATLVRTHLDARPNLRTGGGTDSPWLFPGLRAGQHLHPNTVMIRLRDLGIDLLGARNRALGELVLDCPPSLVAQTLGYSPAVAFLHAGKTAQTWARYTGRRIKSP